MPFDDAAGQTERGRLGRPRVRLALRLAVLLGLGAAVILAAAGAYNLHMQRGHLLSIVNAAADRIVETIRTSTRDAMLRNQPDEVRRIIETIGSQPGIDRIRVFDKRGKIRTSTARDEVGGLVDPQAEQCYACHLRDRPLERLDRDDRMRIFNGDSGRVMAVISPIQNEPDCAGTGCHVGPTEQSLLGVLDVQLSLAEVDQHLSASRTEMAAGLIGTTLGVLGLALLLSWRMVLRPVGRLTDAASRVAAGDLTATVPEDSADEIGELSTTWNAMVGEVARARGRLQANGLELEHKVAEKTAELQAAHDRMMLVEKMASLGKLAAVVAHEINNPLAGIGTYAKLLGKRMATGPPAGSSVESVEDTRRILAMMESEAARCGDIVKNLLLFSRTSGVELEPQEIPPLVQRCTMLIRHKADLAGIGLEVRTAVDLPPIECDGSQVSQMILALVVNAVEASAAGDKVTISTSYDAAEEMLELRVADTGAGIPEDHLAQIFEPFFTTKREGAGAGLGLSVVYGIVHRHHGRCDVDSTLGSGTTFIVRLPRRQPPRTTADTADGGSGAADGGFGSGARGPAGPDP